MRWRGEGGMAEAKRRLAAILSADVAGYSRLMQGDEEATVAALNECRAVFKAKIAQRHGRVVDTAGDSVLAVPRRDRLGPLHRWPAQGRAG